MDPEERLLLGNCLNYRIDTPLIATTRSLPNSVRARPEQSRRFRLEATRRRLTPEQTEVVQQLAEATLAEVEKR